MIDFIDNDAMGIDEEDYSQLVTDVSLPYRYRAREYQKPVWKAMFEENIKRIALIWHRRAGKDKTIWNAFIAKTQERVGVYYYMLPKLNQARKVIWDGIGGDGMRFTDHIPEQLIKSKNNTEMKVVLANGSIIQLVGSDNYDALMGTNPIGIIFSEFSLQDPAAYDYFRPILAENGGWAAFVYTPRGRNHGYLLYNAVRNNPKWFVSYLTVDMTKREDGTPVITEEAIQEERDSGMSESKVQQEFYLAWDSEVEGKIFGKQVAKAWKEERISRIAIDPRLPTYTAWDLGISDYMTVWFFQVYGKEIRFINYYQNHNHGMAHYIKYLKKFEEEHGISYAKHFAPHDIQVRELISGKSRKDSAKEMGVSFTVVKRVKQKSDAIEAGRTMFDRCSFDEVRCKDGLSCLSDYGYEYDEKAKMFKKNPEHNWCSHGSDAFMTFACGWKDIEKKSHKPKVKNKYGNQGWMA
ncbi:MAG: hypothetical protein SVC26_08480 [Pseudomonadota bacterium]|nr:hypothetical protein [Pseudomonadota bacterium]